MPSPTASLATQRPDLAGCLTEFDLAMDRMGFIGLRVLPVLEVAQQAGNYGKISLEQLLQNRETVRAPGGGYNRSQWKFTPATYSTQEHGVEEVVDDREAKMYANYFSAEEVATQRAFDAVLRNHEKRVAEKVFNASTWTGSALTTAVSTEWSSASSATPITDVNAAVKKVWDGTGLWPNALIINRNVFRNLRTCTQILDRIASSGAGYPTRAQDVTTAQLAAVFDLDMILVAGSAKNTANEGQTASISSIWPDEYAMVCRIPTSNDIREPGLGRTFHWGEDGSVIGGLVETYREEGVRGEVVRVRHDVGEDILYTECGHLLSNITA